MTLTGRRPLRVEHRLTQPNASLADLAAAVGLATEHELAALTVSPWLVKAAKRTMGRSRVTLGTVVGFPHGGQVLSVKAFEASQSPRAGRDPDRLRPQQRCARVGRRRDGLQRHACGRRHGAFRPRGGRGHRRARIRWARTCAPRLPPRGAGRCRLRRDRHRLGQRERHDRPHRLLRDGVGPRIGVKASGRFRSIEQVTDAVAAGATRVSTHLTPTLARMVTAEPAAALAG